MKFGILEPFLRFRLIAMIGLAAFFFLALSAWMATQGWKSHAARRSSRFRGLLDDVALLGASALFAVISFIGSSAMFMERSLYALTFAFWMAIINIGTLGIASVLLRLAPKYGRSISDALRMSPLFFAIYWFTLTESVTKQFAVHLSQ